jgi:hypothetical protein
MTASRTARTNRPTICGVQAIKPRRAPQQQVSIRLPRPQVEELDRLARSAGCLRSDLVRQALRLGLITIHALNDQEAT